MVSGGLSRLDEGRKVGGFLLLHFLGGPLLGGFPATSCSSVGRSQSGFVSDIEGSPVGVSVFHAVAWACRTHVDKVAA